jgi:hypothetical protein
MGKIMGKYCKAYKLRNMREFIDWSENVEDARVETKKIDDKEAQERRKLNDDSIIYLQENYVVTDDIYLQENILFNTISPKWKGYRENVLKFVIPNYE